MKDVIKEMSSVNGVRMYKYGLDDDDTFGRPSLKGLFEKGKITEIEYEAVSSSIGCLLLKDCYHESFKSFNQQDSIPTNYTPKGYIRQGDKLINLRKRQDEAIKTAKRKIKCPFTIVVDNDGRMHRVPISHI